VRASRGGVESAPMSSTVEGRDVATSPSESQVPWLRRAWDHMPSLVRRPILRLMRSERIRLRLLAALRIRDESDFTALGSGGAPAIEQALDSLRAASVSGDYYEFGLYRGQSFWSAQEAADRLGIRGMRFFGFDSFAGLPEIEGNDRKAGIFVSGDYRASRDQVEQLLIGHGFDMDRAALVEGFFDQSLTPEVKNQHQMGPAALVMVDCDLYQSTVPALAFVADRLQDGTIVLFDDWYCFGDSEQHGERRAFGEFLELHPEWTAEPLERFSGYGQSFLVRRSTSSVPTNLGELLRSDGG
jgi:O-methyltransferase